MTSQHGNIFIGNNALDEEDRFFFKQCYHFQQIGHVSSECPKKNETPVCFYCMSSHKSKDCPKKNYHLNIAVQSVIIHMFQQKKMIIGLIMQLIHYVLFVSEKYTGLQTTLIYNQKTSCEKGC